MAYNFTQIRELSRSLANRLRGVSSPEDIYSLVYLARSAEGAGCTENVADAIDVASQGDDDIAKFLNRSASQLLASSSFAELMNIVSCFENEAVDA